MVSIAVTYVPMYKLFSTANKILKVKLCQHLFYPSKQNQNNLTDIKPETDHKKQQNKQTYEQGMEGVF